MLQAVVLLQRLSLTQHQQQQQQRREQESQAGPADGVRMPVVMLRDISTTVQAGDRVSPKSEEAAVASASSSSAAAATSAVATTTTRAAAVATTTTTTTTTPEAAAATTTSVKAEPAEQSCVGPSVGAEAGSAAQGIISAGPSGWAGAELRSHPDTDVVAAGAAAESTNSSRSEGTTAAPSDEPEAEVEACQELPPVLVPAEQGEFTMCEEESAGEKAAEPPPPPLSPFPMCGGGQPAEAVDGGEAPRENTTPETVLSEMEAESSGATEAAADASESEDTSVAQSQPAHLHNMDTKMHGDARGCKEVPTPESSSVPSPTSADTDSMEDDGVLPPRSPAPQNKEEATDTVSPPSSSRKRKAPASVDSGSPRSDVEREQSPHSETEQGCRPRRRCAIRKNYALFFAGWNAD